MIIVPSNCKPVATQSVKFLSSITEKEMLTLAFASYCGRTLPTMISTMFLKSYQIFSYARRARALHDFNMYYRIYGHKHKQEHDKP